MLTVREHYYSINQVLTMEETNPQRVRRRATSSSSLKLMPPLPNDIILVPFVELPSLIPTSLSTENPTKQTSQSQGAFPHVVAWAGFSPVLISVWSYSSFLGILLTTWVFYLILPKGLRRQLCCAYPKRYKKCKEKYHAEGRWIYAKDTFMSAGSIKESAIGQFTSHVTLPGLVTRVDKYFDRREESSSRMRTVPLDRQSSHQRSLDSSRNTQGTSGLSSWIRPGSSFDTSSMFQGKDKYYSPGTDSSEFASIQDSDIASSYVSFPKMHQNRTPPSPEHPSIERVPSSTILSETMRRLKDRGVRLIAHGVQCEPKRVWIELDEDTYSLSWQTEFPRKVSNQLGEVSIVLMRGCIHKIALPNVLYIDVGKKTSALMRPENRNVTEACCFSLLTQNGSLDLQTSSRLERDALVSCFSMILDHVHDRDWRNMYDEGSSVISSSVATSQFASDFVEI
jgi:hypothetical protein